MNFWKCLTIWSRNYHYKTFCDQYPRFSRYFAGYSGLQPDSPDIHPDSLEGNFFWHFRCDRSDWYVIPVWPVQPGNCHLSSPRCKTVKIGLDQWIYLIYLSSFPVYISSQKYSKRNIFWTSTLSCQGNTGLTGLHDRSDRSNRTVILFTPSRVKQWNIFTFTPPPLSSLHRASPPHAPKKTSFGDLKL